VHTGRQGTTAARAGSVFPDDREPERPVGEMIDRWYASAAPFVGSGRMPCRVSPDPYATAGNLVVEPMEGDRRSAVPQSVFNG